MSSEKKRGGRILTTVLFLIFFVVFAVSAYMFGKQLFAYREGEEIYAGIEEDVRTEYVPAEEHVQEDPGAYHVQGTLDLNGFTLSELLAEKYTFDFDALLAMNPDVKGWITIEGTGVDYPFVQAEDNDTYLYRTLTGEENKSGSIFLDCRCRDMFSWNMILYGHNMRNHSMFHDVVNYADPDYLAEHPFIQIYTPDTTAVYVIYSCYETGGTSKAYADIEDQATYEAYLEWTMEAAEYDTGITVTGEDQILTLSTCTNDWDGNRYVIHAKRIG